MGLIIWLIIGGIVGWLASIIMRTDAQQGIILNIIVGIIGALLGGWLFSALLGQPSINQDPLDLGAILVSLLGAIVLLGIVNLFRRGTVR
ncbi:MAG TPA: GlsB/YeaQ/YmgE family stress response membrane protein [Herpetosiphonaceae bacterium]